MYLGEHQLGDWLSVPMLDSAWPTDASGDRVYPEVTVFDSNGDVVLSGEQLQPISGVTGFHRVERRLGPEFFVGDFLLLVQWAIGSATFNRAVNHHFSVVAGGHAAGAYVSLHHLKGNNSDFIAGLTDGGLLELRRGPK